MTEIDYFNTITTLHWFLFYIFLKELNIVSVIDKKQNRAYIDYMIYIGINKKKKNKKLFNKN